MYEWLREREKKRIESECGFFMLGLSVAIYPKRRILKRAEHYDMRAREWKAGPGFSFIFFSSLPSQSLGLIVLASSYKRNVLFFNSRSRAAPRSCRSYSCARTPLPLSLCIRARWTRCFWYTLGGARILVDHRDRDWAIVIRPERKKKRDNEKLECENFKGCVWLAMIYINCI